MQSGQVSAVHLGTLVRFSLNKVHSSKIFLEQSSQLIPTKITRIAMLPVNNLITLVTLMPLMYQVQPIVRARTAEILFGSDQKVARALEDAVRAPLLLHEEIRDRSRVSEGGQGSGRRRTRSTITLITLMTLIILLNGPEHSRRARSVMHVCSVRPYACSALRDIYDAAASLLNTHLTNTTRKSHSYLTPQISF